MCVPLQASSFSLLCCSNLLSLWPSACTHLPAIFAQPVCVCKQSWKLPVGGSKPDLWERIHDEIAFPEDVEEEVSRLFN